MKKIKIKTILGRSLVIAALSASVSVKASEEKKSISKELNQSLTKLDIKIQIKDKTNNLRSMGDGSKTEITRV